MESSTVPASTFRSLLLPIALFVFGLAFALGGILLPWIPEWNLFPWALMVVGTGASIAGGVMGIWRLLKLMRGRVREEWRAIWASALAVGMMGIWGVFLPLALFLLQGGLFAPAYVTQHEFPEYQTTLYIYDDSFFDPSTVLKLRRGILPIMWEIGAAEYDPQHFEVVQEGDWVEAGWCRIHLPTGRVEG